jgi:hypothetical protein
MSRLTLEYALSALGDTVVAGTAVFPRGATQAQKIELINQVQEVFLSCPSWKGVDGTAQFAVYNNVITLPRELESIKRGGFIGQGGPFQVPVKNQWYGYSINGPGLTDNDFPRIHPPQFEDIGTGWCTFRDPSAAFTIKVVTDVAETGDITFYGYDENYAPIYTSTTLGVAFDLATAPAATSQVFIALGGVKKPVTNGRVLLYSVDNVTAVETLIAIYQPSETSPSYRRYQVTGSTEETRTFKALCKRAFYRVTALSDTLIPNHLVALKNGLIALNYESKDDMTRAGDALATPPSGWWGKAIRLLNGELAEEQADVGFPVMVQNHAFAGGNELRNML